MITPPVDPPTPPPPVAAPVRSSAWILGSIVLVLLGLAALGGGAWLFKQWKQKSAPVTLPSVASVPPTAIPVPYGHSGTTTPPASAPAAAIADLTVSPWFQALDGTLGIYITARPVGLPDDAGTRFNGWVKDSNGQAVATLDRNQRSPDGGLGFQTTVADGVLHGFIPMRSIGLPPGEYTLRMEVQAVNGSTVSQPSTTDFALRMMACHPDRVQVTGSTDKSGRRMVEFVFDITAIPLRSQMGTFLLRFKRADNKQFIPCNDPQYSGDGLLSVGYRFQMPAQDTILDGLRVVIPLDLFPDTDCLMDIEFYDSANQKLNWLNELRFHPRG
ncbi:hypothetical protein [Prosthecobacter sp.]|uniref:hypothetical protein n=1 Tax=Prosthecobacter sp. TaxID=1965333 RepID=UPI002AC943C1|nr:hypothetical protein [Prosthecobacter sp.]